MFPSHDQGGNTLDVGYFNNTFQCTAAPNNVEGETIDMSLQWNPETKTLDVLKGIIQQFNLVLVPNNDNPRIIEIETMDDWIRSGEVKDWTYRYETAKRKSITHTIDELERELTFKNADDEDRLSKLTIDNDPGFQYGTIRVFADNDLSQGEQTIGDYFAPIVLGGSKGVNPFNYEQASTVIDVNTNFVYPHLYKFDNGTLNSYAFRSRIGYKVNVPMQSTQAFYLGYPFAELEVSQSYGTISNVSSLPVTEVSLMIYTLTIPILHLQIIPTI